MPETRMRTIKNGDHAKTIPGRVTDDPLPDACQKGLKKYRNIGLQSTFVLNFGRRFPVPRSLHLHLRTPANVSAAGTDKVYEQKGTEDEK
jgi:hypothetical protein